MSQTQERENQEKRMLIYENCLATAVIAFAILAFMALVTMIAPLPYVLVIPNPQLIRDYGSMLSEIPKLLSGMAVLAVFVFICETLLHREQRSSGRDVEEQ